jgi:hypothetical protein
MEKRGLRKSQHPLPHVVIPKRNYMKILRSLFNKRRDDKDNKTTFLTEQIKQLVPAANILAISSFEPFLERHPQLTKVSIQDWDFFVTVAVIGSALMKLAHIVPSESQYNQLTAVLSKEVQTWNSNAEYVMGNLMNHIHKTFAKGQQLDDEKTTRLLAALIGAWCMINCGLSVPRERPDPLSIEIGMYILVSFKGWWMPRS